MSQNDLKDGECVRLYGNNGIHIASILPCYHSHGYDYCLPNGKVIYCGVDRDFVECLIANFGVEKIEK